MLGNVAARGFARNTPKNNAPATYRLAKDEKFVPGAK